MAPLSTSIVLAADNVIPRFVAIVNEAVAFNVPPFNVNLSETSVAAAPRLLSADTDTVPCVMVVLPVYDVLAPESVSVELSPDFTNEPAPDNAPENV